MALVHTTRFTLRYSDCDAYAHLNHAGYLRLMQEAAFEASAAAGYDLARYDGLGQIWLIRDTAVEFHTPLVYGDSAQITTWVADFQHVRSRRSYLIHRESDAVLAARAITDWAYLDRATLRPVPIPEAMTTVFEAGGPPPEQAPPRARFPAPPDPPAEVVCSPRRVEWRDVDPMGHTNNAVYASYMEEAAWAASEQHNWPMARFQEAGLGLFLQALRIEYRLPALPGDHLEVYTYLSQVRRASALRHYTVTRPSDGALLARGLARMALVDLQTGRPRPFPPEMLADFAAHTAA